ncbi:MAG: hypothetical protein K1X35_09035 [Caulobacteraceae bacterium]|nr:hypothetical protein [Caulobacteraceae bacterium]
MSRALIALAAVAAVVGLSAGRAPADPAPGGLFCATLDRALAGAAEAPPFDSLHIDMIGAPDSSQLALPGFQKSDCRISWDSDDQGRRRVLWCAQTLAPPELTAANLAADTARCLDREPARERGDDGSGRAYRFDLGDVQVAIDEGCRDECHVGRRVSYRIEARAPIRAASKN